MEVHAKENPRKNKKRLQLWEYALDLDSTNAERGRKKYVRIDRGSAKCKDPTDLTTIEDVAARYNQ